MCSPYLAQSLKDLVGQLPVFNVEVTLYKIFFIPILIKNIVSVLPCGCDDKSSCPIVSVPVLGIQPLKDRYLEMSFFEG